MDCVTGGLPWAVKPPFQAVNVAQLESGATPHGETPTHCFIEWIVIGFDI